MSFYQKYYIHDLKTVATNTNEMISNEVFIKYSPLLDPVRYMIGKYHGLENDLSYNKNKNDYDDEYVKNMKLPSLKDDDTINNNHLQLKLIDKNNASYTDNLFCYLSSFLLNNHNFVHGIDYYGSFLGVQEKFKMDVTDDFEYLNNSTFFVNNNKKMYDLNNNEINPYLNYGSRNNKNKLIINNTQSHNLTSISVIDIDVQEDVKTASFSPLVEHSIEKIYENDIIKISETSNSNTDTSSSNNSMVNYTSDEYSDCGSDDNDDDNNENIDSTKFDKKTNEHNEQSIDNLDDIDDENWETESDETENSKETSQFAFINNFPVQFICLEKCEGTLDELFENNKISCKEGISCLFQIIMILIAYQRTFHFTHNDLHTNNIMYNTTNVKYIYYKLNNHIYKLPTYGKIYKIIDFGRSIYKFNGHLFCSDSFSKNGDASTQYNFEPYIIHNKPRIEPNYSFDLCRLGSSIYDFIIDDEKYENMDELQKIIHDWCLDDNNKNILYKKNREERYPNFKLYKMIARTVHRHTPDEQLEKPIFKKFLVVDKKTISNLNQLIDIDSIPCYI
jgi:hypothetical protein